MGSNKAGISLDPATVQPTVDGLLCRAPPPNSISAVIDATTTAVMSPPTFVYCHLWNERERRAFWTGFLDRFGEFGAEFKAYFVWFKSAFGLGDQDGDFSAAWKSFGSGLAGLAELAYKVAVVANVSPLMRFHPKHDEYAAELKQLGLAITQEFLDGYKRSYAAGGIPQCTGRLYADLVRLVIELLAAKGAGKLASSAGKAASAGGKAAEAIDKLPAPLKQLPAKMAQKPTRWQLIEYIRHDETTSIYARGVLHDLRPGQILLRVEARGDLTPGNWFNGPFKDLKDAQNYAKYLADLGEEGIRRESALPLVWKDGGKGNKVEVIRFYKVAHETPAIGSHTAAQVEGVPKAAGNAADAAKEAAEPIKDPTTGKPLVRAGQGQQLSLPVWQAKNVHGLDLVERMNQFEITVTKK
jgi:hypothetical protein